MNRQRNHVLNLDSIGKSVIKYEIINYPDGQQDIRLDISHHPLSSGYDFSAYYFVVEIISRMNSFKDVERIMCAAAALRNLGIKHMCLNIPYLLGARSDRQFVKGGTSYLKDVLAPLINSLKFDRVSLIDPHSDVSVALLSNVEVLDASFLLKDAVIHNKSEKLVILAPDAGAQKRADKAAEAIKNLNISSSKKLFVDVFTCTKKREVATGRILETIVPVEDFKGLDVYLVDDICDGGKTFIEISKLLKTRNCGRIFLVVTHGIFSKGLDVLRGYFDKIHCTNSVKNVTDPLVLQYTVI